MEGLSLYAKVFHKEQGEVGLIIYNDCFGAYDMLEVSEFQHVGINHSELFAEDRNHINGVGRVWTVMPVRRRRRSADKPLRHSR